MEILQNMLVICDEQGQTPSSGEGMDLVPLSKRPGAFTGFDSEACMQPGSKRSFQLFCDTSVIVTYSFPLTNGLVCRWYWEFNGKTERRKSVGQLGP